MSQKNHYENLPIYKATYQLVLAFQVHCMPHLSRDVRYTIGQGLVKLLMNTIVIIYEANLSHDKHRLLMQGRKLTVETKVTLRMLCDMHQISEGLYLQLSEQAVSVSKQFTAWDNSQYRNDNENNPQTTI